MLDVEPAFACWTSAPARVSSASWSVASGSKRWSDSTRSRRPGMPVYVTGPASTPPISSGISPLQAPDLIAELRRHRPGGLISAGAFGGTHAPASALLSALDLLETGSPGGVHDRSVVDATADAEGGFRRAITAARRLRPAGDPRAVELPASRHDHRHAPSTTSWSSAVSEPARRVAGRSR